MSNETILYDLPNKYGKAWSPNTWKCTFQNYH